MTHPTPPRASVRGVLHAVAVPLALAAVVTAAAPGVITIRRGDTLSELAQQHGTTVAALRALNELDGSSRIYAGSTLRIPAKPAAPSRRVVTVEVSHLVVRGDSLIKIGKKYGVDPKVIAARNALPRSRRVLLGDRLAVPVQKLVTSTPAKKAKLKAFTYPEHVRRSAALHRAEILRTKAPTRKYVRSLVVRTARAQGVDPNLALAVAYQESGFQQRVVSEADAIGVMQVLPSTGRWIGQELLHRRLDLMKVEDNVSAGVAFLRQLTRNAPLPLAVGGYYQGLGSVLRRGMLPQTEVYVASVLRLRQRFAAGEISAGR